MSNWTYDSGQFNLYCDVCKKKIKAAEAKHRWDGFIVCADDWEPRQPQDFVKAKIDKISVPFSRPVEEILWVQPPSDFCNSWTAVPEADQGVSDCATTNI